MTVKSRMVKPRKILIYDADTNARVTKPDGEFTRPLRTMTQQGPRVTIVQSDKINAGRYMDIQIDLLENKDKIDFNTVESVLDYGQYQGLLQFRTGGFGRFTWELQEVVREFPSKESEDRDDEKKVSRKASRKA